MGYPVANSASTEAQKQQLERLRFGVYFGLRLGAITSLIGGAVFVKWFDHIGDFANYAAYIPTWVLAFLVGAMSFSLGMQCLDRVAAIRSKTRFQARGSICFRRTSIDSNSRVVLLDVTSFDWKNIHREPPRELKVEGIRWNRAVLEYFIGRGRTPEFFANAISMRDFPEQEIQLVFGENGRSVVAAETPVGYLFLREEIPSLLMVLAKKAR